MLRLIVDSSGSIKQDEANIYDVDILPIRIQLGEKEFLDGVNLDINTFYKTLAKTGCIPKTSLPSLEKAKDLVENYVHMGDQVLIITMSSEISGTYQALKMLFAELPNVVVFDSRLAVGGMRFLVEEARKYKAAPMDTIVEKLNQLIPKIVIAAIPGTLEYLVKGGRLSKAEARIGTLLSIKPIIGFQNGRVKVLAKKRGLKEGMRYISELVKNDRCDSAYGIIAAYTYERSHLNALIQMTDPELQKQIRIYDNLTPTVACHWGPNAFGYIYVRGDEKDA